jgi:serine protease Do
MKHNAKYIVLIAVVIGVAGLMLFFSPILGFTQVTGSTTGSSLQSPAVPQLTAQTANLESLQVSFREISKKVLPVVVEIKVTQLITQKMPQLNFPFDFPFPFFDQQPQEKGGEKTFRQSGLGSGIIVQRAGNRYYVLTNNHVVKDASDISIQLSDQRVFKAQVVGTDPRKDIALVSFHSGDNLKVAELGDSDTLQVGDIVLAVGNPFGFQSTVTMGIVSALGRHNPDGQVAAYTDYIQTDAAINQGNSGGALVNIAGQVVGINTWIAAPSGGSVGLGFAIPINNAHNAIGQFIAKGKVQYGWLGAQIADIQDNEAYTGFAADLKLEGLKGAFVMQTFKGSPADQAGILPGDYITRVDNTEIANAAELTRVVGGLEAGKTCTFSVIRYGAKTTVSVKIGERDDKDQVAQAKNLWPGLTVIDINDEVRQEMKIPAALRGVVVGSPPEGDTPASIAGFKPGDVITDINGKPVRNMLDYYKALNDRSASQVTFHLVRDGTDIRLGLTP